MLASFCKDYSRDLNNMNNRSDYYLGIYTNKFNKLNKIGIV